MSTTPTHRKRGLLDPAAGKRFRPELLVEIPAIVVMFIMMIHITANALMRTFARSPLPNTLEITEYWYMPIIVFIGFVAAQMRGEHTKADFIFNALPKVTHRYVLGVAYAAISIVCVGFAWFGFQEAMTAFEVRRMAGSSHVVSWPTYFLPPLAFGVMIVQFAYASVHSLRGGTIVERDELDDLEVEIDLKGQQSND